MESSITMLFSREVAVPLILTLKTAAITLMLHLVAGVISGYFLTGEKNFFGFIADSIITLPLVFPPLPQAFCFFCFWEEMALSVSPCSLWEQK